MKRFFAILIALAFFVLPLPTASALGNTGADVLEELKDVDYSEITETTVITVAEIGYDVPDEDFAVLLYVYNAWGNPVRDFGNTVLIGSAVDDSGKINKYTNLELKILDKTADHKIYKFAVQDTEGLLPLKSGNERLYEVASIQLCGTGVLPLTDYKVGKRFTFSGSKLTDTLAMDLDTILEVEVHPVWYRADSSPLATQYDQHRTQLTSVYFSVPERCWNDGFTLEAITADWYEYKTKPIVVTNNVGLYGDLQPYVAKNIKDLSSQPPRLYAGSRYVGDNPYFIDQRATWAYTTYFTNGINYNLIADEVADTLHWLFYDEDLDSKVSGDELLEYAKAYTRHSDYASTDYVQAASGPLKASLFEDSVDEGRTMGYNQVKIQADEDFDLLTYSGTHSTWDTVMDYGLMNTLMGRVPSQDNAPEIKPIEVLTARDVDGNELGEEYYLDQSFEEDFKTFVQEEDEKGKKTVLFRFAVTDYQANKLSADGYGGNLGYVARETVFLNFDIIQLDYSNGKQTVVYPVVSDPTDVVPDVEPPIDYVSGGCTDCTNTPWWLYPVIGLSVCLVLLVFGKFMEKE